MRKLRLKHLSLLFSIIVLMFFGGCKIGPVITILEDPAAYYVPQDSGMCGYTAFYMALKYYGHHTITTTPSYQETIDYPDEVTVYSKVVQNINMYDPYWGLFGLFHSALVNAAENVKGSDGLPLYDTVASDLNDITNTTAKKNRFADYISPLILNGFPVLVHLDRADSYGHWLVVIGMEWAEDEGGNVLTDAEGDPIITDLYYMDPWLPASAVNEAQTDGWACEAEGPDTCFVQKINYDTFMDGAWYRTTGNSSIAYWDGIYITFGNME